MKTLSALSLLAVGAVFASSLFACAAPIANDSSGTGADEAEVVAAKASCSAASYDAAFTHYKSAVDHAKAHNRGDVCEDGTMLADIAGELQAAVTTCGDFRQIVATSKWAQPVRDALEGNLALASVDGRLTVLDEDGAPSLAGLAKALPGTTVFGPAPGVYGNMSKITFGADGAATVSALEIGDEVKWRDTAARFTVTTKSGGAVEITVDVDGTKTTYTAAPDGTSGYDILFVPTSGGDELRSMPSECEA